MMRFTSHIIPRIAHFCVQHKEEIQKHMCTVQIYTADGRFINEIPVRTTLEGQRYADSLAAENPQRTYNVMDDNRNKVYSR